MHFKIYLTLGTVLFFLFGYAIGHGTMLHPTNWFDHKQWLNTSEGVKLDYVGMKSGFQCYSGYDLSPNDLCPNGNNCDNVPYPGSSCMWFNNYTHIQKPTLFDQNLRTYLHINDYPTMASHTPWRAPGFAPINSPCGVAGGNPHGCKGGSCTVDGYQGGIKAEIFKFNHEIKITNWKRGSVVEAAWAITANHGGGYSYRLCKIPKEGVHALTEKCFQKTPLHFYGSTSWIQYGENVSKRKAFKAVRTNVGTNPKGSQWTKNPVPACNGADGGFFDKTEKCEKGTQFPPPVPGVFGYGVNIERTVKPFQFSIVDKLVIPKTLKPGNYVLSFRWDCEQTPQVWNTCASITLE